MSADIQELLGAAFEDKMNNQYTILPCIVVNVRDSLSGQMVDIQPTVNQKLPDGTVSERPVILGVPVSFQVGSTAGFTFPVKTGDTGTAMFAMRSIEAWKSGNGRPSTPTNLGKMDKNDAIFLPGIQPPGSAVNNPAKHVLTHDTNDAVLFQNLGGVESEVRLKADGSIEINTSNRPVVVNCSDATVNATNSISLNTPLMTVDADLTNWIGPINHTGNYTGVGVQTFNGVIFSSHRHAPSIVPPSN